MDDINNLLAGSRPFLEWILSWKQGLAAGDLEELAAKPDEVAILSVDVIKGFCSIGPLSSERVAGIVRPIADLFAAAYAHGVRQFVISQDAHEEDAVELCHGFSATAAWRWLASE